MQRWKTHPSHQAILEGAKRLSYGARAINNGGMPSLPKTVFPWWRLVGCDAGYMNAARIKGSHAAMKSGMLCAEAVFEAVTAGRQHDELSAYPALFEKSWLKEELEDFQELQDSGSRRASTSAPS
jgi:electron-transferring-flavoprotein dehydrogenase